HGAAAGMRRPAARCAACATALVHSPDPAGSDRSRRRGPGRLARTRPRNWIIERLKYASGTPSPARASARNGRHAFGSRAAGGAWTVFSAEAGGNTSGSGFAGIVVWSGRTGVGPATGAAGSAAAVGLVDA